MGGAGRCPSLCFSVISLGGGGESAPARQMLIAIAARACSPSFRTHLLIQSSFSSLYMRHPAWQGETRYLNTWVHHATFQYWIHSSPCPVLCTQNAFTKDVQAHWPPSTSRILECASEQGQPTTPEDSHTVRVVGS